MPQSKRSSVSPITNALFSAIEIEINHACNRRCSYCPNSVSTRKDKGEIERPLFSKIMNELRELQFKGRISYTFYNEPLLHSDLTGIVTQTRNALPKAAIELYTNGTLLSRDRFLALVATGVSRFIVTKHEGEANHPFAAVYQGLDDHHQNIVQYRDFSQLKLTNRGGILKHLGAEGLPLLPCFIPSMVVTVTLNGNVLPCFEDFHERLVMGNIRDQKLLDIWHSEKYTRFRKNLRDGLRHLHAPCRACNRREVLPPFDVIQSRDH